MTKKQTPSPAAAPAKEPTRLPGSIAALRTARYAFAHERMTVLGKLHADIELAECTTRVLEAIRELIKSHEQVPYPLSIGRSGDYEEPSLPPVVWRRRAELQTLANSYGVSIEEHPTLRNNGVVTYWEPFAFDELMQEAGPAV